MNTYDPQNQDFLSQQLAKLNKALALLSAESPSPDMPVQVADLLGEVIDAWSDQTEQAGDTGEAGWLEPPDLDTIIQWFEEDGGCEATDGCWVEVDGTCPHGHKSWMLVLGLV